MADGLGASTRVTSGSSSAVRGISPGAGGAQGARGSDGGSTRATVAARGGGGRRAPTACPHAPNPGLVPDRAGRSRRVRAADRVRRRQRRLRLVVVQRFGHYQLELVLL